MESVRNICETQKYDSVNSKSAWSPPLSDAFAMPGSAFSEKIKVTNWLIQQGANITTTADDILEVLKLENQSVQSSFV
jgi:predicted Rossmann fold nucleotide-binding protein DprA/Smf involved in DNA uptake